MSKRLARSSRPVSTGPETSPGIVLRSKSPIDSMPIRQTLVWPHPQHKARTRTAIALGCNLLPNIICSPCDLNLRPPGYKPDARPSSGQQFTEKMSLRLPVHRECRIHGEPVYASLQQSIDPYHAWPKVLRHLIKRYHFHRWTLPA